MRIGIDVGGTNTDAVLMDGNRVVAWHKTATTADVSSGIIAALEHVLSTGDCAPQAITAVMIGTTHFTNAVVERRRLLEVAAVRIALPATQALPPMVDWPADLRDALGNHTFYVHGGYDFNGIEISPVDENEIRTLGGEIRSRGVRSVALTSVFAPVNGEQEQRVAEILREQLPDVMISLSSEIGRIGLLERENATIMNACLVELAIGVVESFRTALAKIGIAAPFYISQNDGTLMASDVAERYPILTFASGPTNSMRGGAFLSGAQDAVIVDIGGTTSDIGVLVRGFPREAATEVEIADVRTNFRMPDIISLGLGGGSLVRADGDVPVVGPESVGYELTTRGLVFGGDTLTATDIAVAAGLAVIGDPALVADLDPAFVTAARDRIRDIVEQGIDRIKTVAGAVPVVLVGGGTLLLGHELAGASQIIKPEHAAVANAIGAAIAQAGGEVDHVYSLDGTTREAVLAQAREEAIGKAVAAGAQPDTVKIVDVDEIPLTYMPGNAIRFRVKAVGELELGVLPVAS
jgi:N-methylhydantoinase A/oxoprolinase/acetone carboxylase beta subunit